MVLGIRGFEIGFESETLRHRRPHPTSRPPRPFLRVQIDHNHVVMPGRNYEVDRTPAIRQTASEIGHEIANVKCKRCKVPLRQ
ncbi:hypothetical protein AVEN_51244-1 [Araneus ventricosus]|uniref:Uncharacterized protein n=1 Tax=Araneus ventricosus TaxID=182803 RepID=A0A4Y2RED0_ARAVE|nr:hypothetical protein AVEN_225575-1 [Araneus ventricosus]GBN73802.1 hypothetical protein AVEN_51244-1 [Araneus ventricosus]